MASGFHHLGHVLLYIYGVTPVQGRAVSEVIARWRGSGIPQPAAGFAREAVLAVGPAGPARARSLLWATSRLAAWGLAVGLDPMPEVLLHPSVIERFVTFGMRDRSATARRTARTNLRFVARRVAPQLPHPQAPAPLARQRAKAPYTQAEIDGFLALAAAQPTEARRHRLAALVCLGAGAGLSGEDLRHLTGAHVRRRAGGVVAVVEGRRARVVPVLARYHRPLVAAATFAADGCIVGGRGAGRHNVTNPLLAAIAGGVDLPRLELPRLRATWLAIQAAALGLRELFAAAGVTHSQQLCDLVAQLPAPTERELIARLGGAP